MKRFTGRELALVAAVALVGVVAAALSLAVDAAWGAAAAALLATPVVVLLLDVRHRARLLAKTLGRQERHLGDLREQLTAVGAALPSRAWLSRQEATGRRAVGGLEQLRLEGYDRHVEVRRELAAARDDLRGLDRSHAAAAREADRQLTGLSRGLDALDRQRLHDLQQVEALLQLHRLLDPPAPVPLAGNWAMDARGLLGLVEHVRRHPPRTVVELGGGTSTAWLALSLPAGARVVSFDHDEVWAERTREALAALGDGGPAVDVRVAPLAPVRLGDDEVPWYDLRAFDDLRGIDLLLVDGPPKATGAFARHPALPLLVDRLADTAFVLLDDAQRDDERASAQTWLADVPGLTLLGEPASGDRQLWLRYDRPAATA